MSLISGWPALTYHCAWRQALEQSPSCTAALSQLLDVYQAQARAAAQQQVRRILWRCDLGDSSVPREAELPSFQAGNCHLRRLQLNGQILH